MTSWWPTQESFSDALKQGLTDGVVSSETLTQAVHNLREKMTGMSQEERKAAGYTAEMIEQIEALDKGLQNGSVSMEEFTEKILRPSGRENDPGGLERLRAWSASLPPSRTHSAKSFRQQPPTSCTLLRRLSAAFLSG